MNTPINIADHRRERARANVKQMLSAPSCVAVFAQQRTEDDSKNEIVKAIQQRLRFEIGKAYDALPPGQAQTLIDLVHVGERLKRDIK